MTDQALLPVSKVAARLGISAPYYWTLARRGVLPLPVPGSRRVWWPAVVRKLELSSGIVPGASEDVFAEWSKANGFEV
jgi:hypothetical protein